MAITIIGLNDAKAVKRYSGFLAVDTPRISYFGRKFMGDGPDTTAPIQRLTQLENEAGEQITYDLSMAMRMQPVEGDNVLENREENLRFYTDSVYIDQMRGGINTGGRMTRKRTLHDLRKVARKRQSEWWARVFDELFFMYLSGARGSGHSDYIFPTTYTGFANNSFSTPDAFHHFFAKNYPGQTTHTGGGWLGATQNTIPSVQDLEYIAAYIQALGGGVTGVPAMHPIKVEGEDHYVCLISPFGAYALRTSASTGQWLDIQKALATAVGKDSNILKGGEGMINNIVIHKHQGVIQFTTADTPYGATACSNTSARGLVLGRQAAVCAFGSPGNGLRFDWNEDSRDNNNQAVITTSAILGVKKTTFNSLDFGVLAYDYYDPRA